MSVYVRTLYLFWILLASVQATELPPTPGERYDVGGYQLHINCLGNGSPTIIIDTGLGDDSSSWQTVLHQASQISKVCVYDRPGYGWSDFGPRPRNSRRIAYELDLLLQQAQIPPPYILVGHSFGGYNMRVFAASNPEKIVGMILVDASHEHQHEILNINLPKNNPNSSNIVMLSTNLRNEYAGQDDQVLRDRAFRTASYEINSLHQSSKQVQRFSHIPTVPLIVISRGQAEWYGSEDAINREKTWIRMQQDLTKLSPLSQHIFAHHSGHDIHKRQPQIIIDAILEIVHLARVINTP